jgi:hypothetical protein
MLFFNIIPGSMKQVIFFLAVHSEHDVCDCGTQ